MRFFRRRALARPLKGRATSPGPVNGAENGWGPWSWACWAVVERQWGPAQVAPDPGPGLSGRIKGGAFSPDESLLVTCGDELLLWHATRRRIRVTFEGRDNIGDIVAFSPCGRYITSTCATSRRRRPAVVVHDASTGKAWPIAVAPNGKASAPCGFFPCFAWWG